jgi:hypothetical protein
MLWACASPPRVSLRKRVASPAMCACGRQVRQTFLDRAREEPGDVSIARVPLPRGAARAPAGAGASGAASEPLWDAAGREVRPPLSAPPVSAVRPPHRALVALRLELVTCPLARPLARRRGSQGRHTMRCGWVVRYTRVPFKRAEPT